MLCQCRQDGKLSPQGVPHKGDTRPGGCLGKAEVLKHVHRVIDRREEALFLLGAELLPKDLLHQGP
jgi:hypothetical protein